jgi:hypothetical protein
VLNPLRCNRRLVKHGSCRWWFKSRGSCSAGLYVFQVLCFQVCIVHVVLNRQHDVHSMPPAAAAITRFVLACCRCRAVIIPVMERVLGPYLRGGGAKAFNFQV